METEGGGFVRREFHALVGRQLAPAVDRLTEQGAEFGGVGRSLAADGHLGVAGDERVQLLAVGGEVGDVALGGLDVVFVEGDERFARGEGVSVEEAGFDGGAAAQRAGGLVTAAISEVSHGQAGEESRAEEDESEVEAEVLLETVHELRGPFPYG